MYTPDQLREIIAEMKANFTRPDLPFGIDLALPQLGGSARKTNHDYTGGKLDELIDIVVESGARLFVSAVGVPPKAVIERLHKNGILVMNMVGHPKHAVKALDLGVDLICAQGGEGGGHTGDVANSVLIPAVVDVANKYKPPMLNGSRALVVAAGGISSGRSLASSLMQGAAGRLGGHTVRSVGRGRLQRGTQARGGVTNDYIRGWHARPQEVAALCEKGIIPIEHDFDEGNDVDPPHLMGQVAGAVQRIQPAGEIVDEIVKEAEEMLKLGGTYLTGRSRL
ncbi:hypothetical protein G7046_g970 [Stylonectria norvegica]|nr:hypothetical protein G7046_g970 [Stylonectria norvegica]